jgi:hypothetical protein
MLCVALLCGSWKVLRLRSRWGPSYIPSIVTNVLQMSSYLLRRLMPRAYGIARGHGPSSTPLVSANVGSFSAHVHINLEYNGGINLIPTPFLVII